jgi:hypothetical protein
MDLAKEEAERALDGILLHHPVLIREVWPPRILDQAEGVDGLLRGVLEEARTAPSAVGRHDVAWTNRGSILAMFAIQRHSSGLK